MTISHGMFQNFRLTGIVLISTKLFEQVGQFTNWPVIDSGFSIASTVVMQTSNDLEKPGRFIRGHRFQHDFLSFLSILSPNGTSF